MLELILRRYDLSKIISKASTNIPICSYRVFPPSGHVVEIPPECLHDEKTHKLITAQLPLGFSPGLP